MSYYAKNVLTEQPRGDDDPHDLEAQYQAYAEKALREAWKDPVALPDQMELRDPILRAAIRDRLEQAIQAGVDDVTYPELERSLGLAGSKGFVTAFLVLSAQGFLRTSNRFRPNGRRTHEIVVEALR